jgi:hypothetical protein
MSEADVLDYLRAQFARVHTRLDDLAQWTAEADRRFLAIERSIAALRRDAVLDAEAAVERQARSDALAVRVARIERRLDLAEPAS